MKKGHTFHIPVMGIAFTIDTPLKVAKYGISSVISLVDDTLIEQMRKFYCNLYHEDYTEIQKDDSDHRARRITAYLNLLDRIIKKQVTDLKSSAFEAGSEITKYFELLPETSPFKKKYQEMLSIQDPKIKEKLQNELRESVRPGSIDVNIMTKLDRTNYDKDGKELPAEFSDALSALRGYAQSTLKSAIVFSAGFNRRLYSYVENFKDFYCDAAGEIKKKIILKVSDHRSCITQGKFLAKKGLWVSEYRIESGLNCGGHAFISDGFLLGPILEEMKVKRDELFSGIKRVYQEAVKLKNKISSVPPDPKITVQGGIGTFQEDQFLMNYYNIDGTGWATPFLLVPEVVSIDASTLEKLRAAGEDDLYLSDSSPIGVPFNNLKGAASNVAQENRAKAGCPGSGCFKGHLKFNTEFTDLPICVASRQYQKLKLEQIENSPNKEDLPSKEDVIVKTCICHDLGASALIVNNIETKLPLEPAVCPGPNLAYFSKVVTLKEMTDHIYGRINLLNSKYRQHVFIREIKLYVDSFVKEIKRCKCTLTDKQIAYFSGFKKNLIAGIDYYRDLFSKLMHDTQDQQKRILDELKEFRSKLESITPSQINQIQENK
ncbi:MAG: hypothetical protein PHY73_03110 [Candidatus Omnitrophica bacterium]|nr:hypothetical protein [Candidatus Omnitrophota bacterium]